VEKVFQTREEHSQVSDRSGQYAVNEDTSVPAKSTQNHRY